jgi:hypothetical protein
LVRAARLRQAEGVEVVVVRADVDDAVGHGR